MGEGRMRGRAGRLGLEGIYLYVEDLYSLVDGKQE